MFQGKRLEPKKGKTVGSVANRTIEHLKDNSVQTFPI